MQVYTYEGVKCIYVFYFLFFVICVFYFQFFDIKCQQFREFAPFFFVEKMRKIDQKQQNQKKAKKKKNDNMNDKRVNGKSVNL